MPCVANRNAFPPPQQNPATNNFPIRRWQLLAVVRCCVEIHQHLHIRQRRNRPRHLVRRERRRSTRIRRHIRRSRVLRVRQSRMVHMELLRRLLRLVARRHQRMRTSESRPSLHSPEPAPHAYASSAWTSVPACSPSGRIHTPRMPVHSLALQTSSSTVPARSAGLARRQCSPRPQAHPPSRVPSRSFQRSRESSPPPEPCPSPPDTPP